MKIFNSKIASILPMKAAISTYLIIYSCMISAPAHAEKVTILIGGALHTCSSYSQQNCQNDQVPSGKQHALYNIDDASLGQLSTLMDELSESVEDNALGDGQSNILQKIKALRRHQGKTLTKSELLSLWNESGSPLSYALSDTLYYALLDTLEIAQQREIVNVAANRSSYAADIVKHVEQQTRRLADERQSNQKPKILVITASGRDPYESADFYEQLFTFDGIATQWLALTPALVDAITAQDCSRLDDYRQTHNTFARQTVYPHRTAQEQALCQSGAQGIIDAVRAATTLVFNGGDQSLTRKVLFDSHNQAYPWTTVIKARPAIVGTSAGTAVQSGGSRNGVPVPMISNGSAVQALNTGAHAGSPPSQRCRETCSDKLHPDALTYVASGGLGRVAFLVDTHFSERNRSVRLHVLARDTGQSSGFGVDETTALVVTDSQDHRTMKVIGENGVVKIVPQDKQTFLYSYYPSGTSLFAEDNNVYLKHDTVPQDRTATMAYESVNLLSDAQLRSITQTMCAKNIKSSTATHRKGDVSWQFVMDASNADYVQVHEQSNGCAIESLRITYQMQPG